MPNVGHTVQLLGGIATTSELLRRGVPVDWIRMAVAYGRIVRIRKGWFASLDVPPDAIDARHIGGKLACVSALLFHGALQTQPGAPGQRESALHVAVRANASRLRVSVNRDVVIHWYRRQPEGDALAVSVEEAWAQRARCRALHGSTDSL